MKARPDTAKFKKNPAAFLEGAAEQSAPPPAPPAPAAAPAAAKPAKRKEVQLDFHQLVTLPKDRPATEQKGYRLRLETIANIEREVYASRARGAKITQTKLIEQALAAYFSNL